MRDYRGLAPGWKLAWPNASTNFAAQPPKANADCKPSGTRGKFSRSTSPRAAAGSKGAIMNSTADLDLSRVYRNCIFQSHSAQAAHARISRDFSAHDLDWRRGRVDTALFHAQVQRMGLFVLRYGAEVEIQAAPFKGFALVQMPLRGAAEIECDGARIVAEPGRVALVAPRRKIRLVWERGCEQLLLKVPLELMRQAVGDPCGSCERGIELDPAFVLDPEWHVQWCGLVQQLLNALPAPGAVRPQAGWLGHFEQTVAMFLLAHQPKALADDARDDEAALSSRLAQRKLAAVEDYMRACLSAPIALADLAKASGVSARTLNILCHRHRGVAPMVLLRNARPAAERSTGQRDRGGDGIRFRPSWPLLGLLPRALRRAASGSRPAAALNTDCKSVRAASAVNASPGRAPLPKADKPCINRLVRAGAAWHCSKIP